MSCRTPQLLRIPYLITNPAVPSAGQDLYVLADVRTDPSYAAVEIDASSEIDCCIVEHSSGARAFVAPGSPAIGPLNGPLFIKPWRRVMPYSNDGQGYKGAPLTTNPPMLALKVHYDMPPAFQGECRAPFYRKAPAVTTGAAYAVAAEFPLYGHRLARITVTNAGGVNSLTYKIEGAQYLAKNNNGSGELGEPVGYDAAPERIQLVLDGTGAVERTVAFSSVDSITITDEPFDTLIVSVKHPVAATTAQFQYAAQKGG